jgi:putative endonuclease
VVTASRDPRRGLGRLGERLAAEHLEARGLVVIDRNFRTRLGEIDLVARDKRFLVFCEVKTRLVRGWRGAGAEPGPLAPLGPLGPLAAVGPRKRRQVRTMARAWLTATSRDGPSPPEIRFDAIGICLDQEGRIVELEHVEGAF